MRRLALAAAILVVLVFAGCGTDESREDARDATNVDKTPPEIVTFNNHYPNVELKCDGHGHRIYVTTHDSATGNNVLVVEDATCSGRDRAMNIYYDPGSFGLTIIAELAKPPNYDFDMVVLWRDRDGKVLGGHDSGCSCPTPFEDHQVSDLVEVGGESDLRQLVAKISEVPAVSVLDFIAKYRLEIWGSRGPVESRHYTKDPHN